MKYADTPLLRIAYEEYGDPAGIPVILLHGFPYDIHAFDEAVWLLNTQHPGKYRILTPWLRGYGPTRFLSEETMRSGEQGALASDLLAFMDALSVGRAVLAGFDWGGRAACVVAALWPERVIGLVSCGVGYNMHDPAHWTIPREPEDEARTWYVWYLNTQRGANSLRCRRKDLCCYLWHTWSPDWRFKKDEFDLTAKSFDNEDFVPVVLHSYRNRIGEVSGDPRYEEISRKIARKPKISVPAVILLGESDGVTPPPVADTERDLFTGSYERYVLHKTGHNIPQERPSVFVKAVAGLTE